MSAAKPKAYVHTRYYGKPPGRDIDERIDVEFEYDGDNGCNGSGVSFQWHRFDNVIGRRRYGLEVSAWGDGLGNLLDPRIQRVLRALRSDKERADRRAGGYTDLEATPERVLDLLACERIREVAPR